jgi:DNA-binding IclR family transcriptional regulator
LQSAFIREFCGAWSRLELARGLDTGPKISLAKIGCEGYSRPMPKSESQKYRAPALEKGLDIIELLASAREPLSLNRISSALGRTVSELFRMVQVLEYRGYVENSGSGGGYVLSNRLFALGMTKAPTKDLLDAALPVMRRLAEALGQSCHIAVASGDQMVVVARVEAPSDIGFAVRVGHRRDLVHSTSGLVLYAFQSQTVRDEWKARLGANADEADWAMFESLGRIAREDGFVKADSQAVEGVIDLSAPVVHQGFVLAALTMPFVKTRNGKPIDEAIKRVMASAREISGELAGRETLEQSWTDAAASAPAASEGRGRARKAPQA